MSVNTPEIFWAKVDKSDECWKWTGQRGRKGYGALCLAGRTWRAHRLAWFLTHGPIPEGMLVCHRCDNRECCRPDHIGTAHPMAKLTEAQVVELRAARAGGAPIAYLAKTYGIDQASVSHIAKGKTWKHLQQETK